MGWCVTACVFGVVALTIDLRRSKLTNLGKNGCQCCKNVADSRGLDLGNRVPTSGLDLDRNRRLVANAPIRTGKSRTDGVGTVEIVLLFFASDLNPTC